MTEVPAEVSEPPVLELRDVKRHYVNRGHGWREGIRPTRAVDGISITLQRGQSLGVVGESGCGKTTLTRLALLLETPTAGLVSFHGKNTREFSREDRKRFRRSVQAVFQDPFASLSPRMSVEEIVAEPGDINLGWDRQERRTRIMESLEEVGLPASAASKYPHEFSGGQRQRIAIARAIATNPEVIILDEPTSSLDVSIRSQVVNLLLRLRRERNLSYLTISHDLSMLRHLAGEIAVMYLGRIVEYGRNEEVFGAPAHPYTRALLSAVLTPDPDAPLAVPVSGEPPSPIAPPPGCHFHPRCPSVLPQCSTIYPDLSDRRLPLGAGHRLSSCHLHPLTGEVNSVGVVQAVESSNGSA